MEIKWVEQDPETGERLYIRAEKFARKWHFRWKRHRRDDWQRGLEPTRAMWEHVLGSLRDRYRRRAGATEEDIAAVEKTLAEWRDPPTYGGD